MTLHDIASLAMLAVFTLLALGGMYGITRYCERLEDGSE